MGLVRRRLCLPAVRPMGAGGGAPAALSGLAGAVPGGHAGPAGPGGQALLRRLDGEGGACVITLCLWAWLVGQPFCRDLPACNACRELPACPTYALCFRPHHPQASLWNFVRYNVVGGGDSALYGVEDASFYLRNALNNFQVRWQ